jgi:predicted RNase H-like HicB family nuclease
MARFTVLLYQEEGGYSAVVPGLHVATEGRTIDEALAMAKEAAELRIEALVRDGEPVLDEETPPIVAAIDIAVTAPATA